MRRRRRLEWFKDRLYGVLDEVVAGLIIVAILGAVSYIGWLATNVLPGLFANPALVAAAGVVAVVLLAAVVTLIWRRRARFVPRRRLRAEEELDAAVARLFTGRTEALDAFRQLLATERPERRIVAVHGVGGVGKSWLLRMYRQMCREASIAVALVSGDETRSALDVLRTFSYQLDDQGVALSNFEAKLERYRRIQAKVQEKTEAWSALTKLAVEGGKALPMVGPAIGALGVEGVEQMVSLLRSFLVHDEVELYLNPEATLTECFLKDLSLLPESQRLVLMFDTYEQMEGMDDWVRGLAAGKLGERALVVIAGRAALKGEWWKSCGPWIEPIELAEFDEEEAWACLERYRHEVLRRPLEAEVARGVVHFAEGLPLALSWSVYLMQQYGTVEFAAVRRGLIGDLVDTMTREAGEGWRHVLEACAVVRWFNEDTLRAMLEREDPAPLYEELRRFPFVRPRPEGLALHDRVRDWMNEDLVARAPERWWGLNERAAKFYEVRLAKIEAAGEKFGEEWQQLIVEKLYHWVRVDDNIGLILLKELFEEAQLRYPKSMRILLLESAKTDSRFADRKSRWVRYYEARLNDDHDEKAKVLKELISEPDLELLARTSLGIALFDKDKVDPAIDELEKNLQFLEPAIYKELSLIERATAKGSCRYLGTMYKVKGRYEDAIEILVKCGDPPALAEAARSRFFQGRFGEAVNLYLQSLKMLGVSDAPVRYEIRYRRQLGHVYQSQGRYEEAQREFKCSKAMAETIENRFDTEVALCNLAIIAQDITVLESAVDYLTGNLHLFVGQKPTVSWYVIELARLRLMKGDYDKAETSFQQALDLAGRTDYNVGILRSLLGLCNLHYARGTLANIPRLADKVEHLSLEYECWDQLARLRVVQGNLSADESSGLADNDARRGELLEDAFVKYSEAMTYALRYNRYLLDEVLEQIIAKCKERGVEGRAMLERLAEFWRTGKTEEGVALVEAERAGREREKGDGKPQVMVLERLQAEMGKSLEVR